MFDKGIKMKEILLSIKSQLIYVIENQYKLKAENFLSKYHTPDLDPDLLTDYFTVISDDIVAVLENNYEDIVQKGLYIQNKFPDVKQLSEEDKQRLSEETITFINDDLSQIIFNKIYNNIVD